MHRILPKLSMLSMPPMTVSGFAKSLAESGLSATKQVGLKSLKSMKSAGEATSLQVGKVTAKQTYMGAGTLMLGMFTASLAFNFKTSEREVPVKVDLRGPPKTKEQELKNDLELAEKKLYDATEELRGAVTALITGKIQLSDMSIYEDNKEAAILEVNRIKNAIQKEQG